MLLALRRDILGNLRTAQRSSIAARLQCARGGAFSIDKGTPIEPERNYFFESPETTAFEEIKCEIEPTLTRPKVVSEPPEDVTPVREILAVHMSGCDSTVVVEYSLLSGFFEAESGMMAGLVGVG